MTMTKRARRSEPAHPIHSVDNAFAILRLIARGRRVRVGEVAQELNLSASSTSRLFSMLEYHGFASKEAGTRGYVIGSALKDLGYSALCEAEISAVAHPFLKALAATFAETVHLARLQANNVVFIDAFEGSGHDAVCSRTGAVLPAHATAVGKAMLAELSENEFAAAFQGDRLQKWTSRSISSRLELERHLEVVRNDGYAVNYGECERDVCAVAVALKNRNGKVSGAISLSMRPASFGHEIASAFAKQLLLTARALSPQLR